MNKTAKAEVPLLRQRTQYSCMAAALCASLNALGYKCNEDEVNDVMGARPMKGAAWEQALACAQHFGVRGTLVCPSTVPQLKSWTDAGFPVMIAWNPEGRDWSHASVVYDVTESLPAEISQECVVVGEGPGPWVWVSDTNIPNPEKTVRIVSADAFYSKWFEKWPNYLVRRPALMLNREITPEGRQVMASRTVPVTQKAPPQTKFEDPTQTAALALIERGGAGAGKHRNKQDFDRGHARNPKHKGLTRKEWDGEATSKQASGLTFANHMYSWWDEVYENFVAEAKLLGNKTSLIQRSLSDLSLWVHIADPFVTDSVMSGAQAPRVYVALQMENLGRVSTTISVVLGKKVLRKKSVVSDVSQVDAEFFAANLFGVAMDEFEHAEFAAR